MESGPDFGTDQGPGALAKGLSLAFSSSGA